MTDIDIDPGIYFDDYCDSLDNWDYDLCPEAHGVISFVCTNCKYPCTRLPREDDENDPYLNYCQRCAEAQAWYDGETAFDDDWDQPPAFDTALTDHQPPQDVPLSLADQRALNHIEKSGHIKLPSRSTIDLLRHAARL